MFNVRKIKSFFPLIFKIHKSINDNNWAAVLVQQQRQQVGKIFFQYKFWQFKH